MRQTDLPGLSGMIFLSAEQIRDPDLGTMVLKDFANHLRPPRWANHVQAAVLILKPPFPLGLSVDSGTRLVGTDEARWAQSD